MKRERSSPPLPDVDVLLALAWLNHQFHRLAVRRQERGCAKWATCALTQLGFIRLSSTPAAAGSEEFLGAV